MLIALEQNKKKKTWVICNAFEKAIKAYKIKSKILFF